MASWPPYPIVGACLGAGPPHHTAPIAQAQRRLVRTPTVIISAFLAQRRVPNELLRLARAGAFLLSLSEEILTEAQGVLLDDERRHGQRKKRHVRSLPHCRVRAVFGRSAPGSARRVHGAGHRMCTLSHLLLFYPAEDKKYFACCMRPVTPDDFPGIDSAVRRCRIRYNAALGLM
jgi:hypothetical protein